MPSGAELPHAYAHAQTVNGSRGVVVDFKRVITPENSNSPSFDTGKEYPEVLFTSGVRRIITPEEWNIEGTFIITTMTITSFLISMLMMIPSISGG